MLRNSFIHIPQINRDTEHMIWQNGVFDWQEFIQKIDFIPISQHKKSVIIGYVMRSIKALDEQDFSFFSENMPSNQLWRLYPEMKKKCCFLDIETTGLSRYDDEVTVIGLYNGKESKVFIQGQNISKFKSEIKKYEMIITYNGKCFDIPFLKSKFPDINLDKVHIDLRYVLRELGYTGGLKNIEKSLGIKRDKEIENLDGLEAVRLWRRYTKGEESALEKLVKYNIADVENLQVLMEFAFKKLKQKYLYKKTK